MKKLFTLFFIAIAANFILTSSASGQIGLVSVSSPAATATGGSGSLTINKPSGLAVGHVMIANIHQVGFDNNSLSDASLTGWTEIDGNSNNSGDNRFRGTLLYRIADAADVAAASFAFTIDTDQDDAEGFIVAFSGVDVIGGLNQNGGAGGPFDVDPGSWSENANNSLSATGFNTATPGAAVIMFSGLADNSNIGSWSTTNPGSLTELYDNPLDGPGGAVDLGIGAAWATKASTGATGNGTATTTGNPRHHSIMVALRPILPTVNAGPDQLVGGTSVSLSGSTTAVGPTYAWTKTSGPGGETIVSPSSPATSVTGLVEGTYVFRLTVNGVVFDEVTVRVITGSNLWATSSDGNQISSYTVSSGAYTSGPTNIFAPLGGSTAALGRNDKTSATSGYFYWLPNSGTNGVVNVYAATAAGNDRTLIATFDVNGGSNNSLGYVRLGMGPDGTGWILARESTTNTIYLAKFMSNGVNPVTVTVEDASVSLTGGINADFVNGDLCLDAGGKIYALANNGAGVTQIFIGAPAGAATTLVKKWDLVDPSNVPFTGSVNGVAFDVLGALYITTGDGLYYIDPTTVNGPAGTVECSLVDVQTGLQDLASNVFPSTILLPIKLGAFTVIKQGSNALLNWTTLNEMNTDHFEIERSYDGVNFTIAGQMQAAGNSTSDINYNFTDPITISSGIIYYRLKTLDIDGQISYSKIVALRLNGGIVKNFTVYPNPFSGDLKIEMESARDAAITVRISNAIGQAVVSRNTLLQKGNNVIVLSAELSALKAGMYVVEIISEDGRQSQKIIKR